MSAWSNATKRALLDAAVPGWRMAQLVGGHRRVRAPYREDRHASLDIHEEHLVWKDRATDAGGSAWDLAVLTIGRDAAQHIVAELESNATPARSSKTSGSSGPTEPGVEIVGPPTSAQIQRCIKSRRVTRPETLRDVGAKCVRWSNLDWLGIPAVGGWKLWAVDSKGKPRLDDRGRVQKRNIGPASIHLSPQLATVKSGEVLRIHDVEGESDLLAAVEAGLVHVVSGTTGAAATKGHEAHREVLVALRPAEVIVWADQDDAGKKGAQTRGEWWLSQGVPVRLPALPAEVGEGGDLRDFLLGRPARDGTPGVDPLGGAADLDSIADAVEQQHQKPANRSRAVAPLASEVKPERLEWLWKGRIPLGAVTLIDGDPGNGKSALTCDIAARVSRGDRMPDGTPGISGGVVMMNLEDHHAATIVPRLMAAGAQLDRVRLWRGVETSEGERLPTLDPGDLTELEALIELTHARLVIVDPLMAVLPGKVNSYNDHHIRLVLAPLSKLAERLGFAAVVVRHFTKASGGPALYRGGGSIGIIGAARSALAVGKDPADPDRRVLAVNKSNLGSGNTASLGYRMVGVDVEGASDVARVEWTGEVAVAVDQLVSAPLNPEERGALDEAIDWLREKLSSGAVPTLQLERAADEAGISRATLRRARSALGVKSKPGIYGGPWVCAAPDSTPGQSCSTPPRVAHPKA